MKYNARLSKIYQALSKEESRPALKGAFVDVSRKAIVATEGNILVAIDVTDLIEDGEESFIIPYDALKAAKKLAAGRNAAVVHIRQENDRVNLYQRGKLSQSFDTVIGKFPDYVQVAPSRAKVEAEYKPIICLSPELLLKLADAMRGEGKDGVTLWVKDSSSAVLITTANDESAANYGVIMPRRHNNERRATPPAPFWEPEPVETSEEVSA